MNRNRSIVGQTMVSASGSQPFPVPMTLPLPSAPMAHRGVSAESFADMHLQAEDIDSMHHGHRADQSEDTSFGNLLSPLGTPMGTTPRPSHNAISPASPYEGENDYSMLSHIATLLRDSVPRGTQIKGSISYPRSFTGKDVVSTILALIPREHLAWAAGQNLSLLDTTTERGIVLRIAKSLKNQLYFHEVDWGIGELDDSVDDVYMFLEDSLGTSRATQAFDVELSKAGAGLKDGQGTSASDVDDLPTGIFTPMTACYSPLCGKPGSPSNAFCYSSSCPRSQSALSVPPLSAGAKPGPATAGASHNAIAWADTVPPDLLDTMPKKEIKRQNAILELIQKDEEFLHDLELLDDLFLANLLPPPGSGDPIMDAPELDSFVLEVFSNHTELTSHVRVLVERLHVRQREEGPIVKHVGDLYLHAALEWGGAFEANMTSFPLAKHRLAREAAVNPRLQELLERCRRDPRSHRLPMDHFLQRATTRLPRYNLHFKSILADTDPSSADNESLSRAIELVDEQCKSIQKGVAAAEVKVKIRDYAFNLATKRNKLGLHMDLLNPERQLVHQGRAYRKPDFTDFEWQDLLCMLFDNYLVVTKTKKREEGDRTVSRFVVEKRPIAVEMIQLIGFRDAPVSRSIGLSNFHLRSDRENRDLFPFTVAHLGGKIEPLTLYVSTKEARDEWYAKLNEAIGLRTAMQEANKVFEALPISSNRFAIPLPGSMEGDKAPTGVESTDFHGQVTCVFPFQMHDGRRLIAVGCADGVWIGLRNDPRSLRKVLHVTFVTQCAVMEEFGIFVVLANRVLFSYSLDVLVPNANSPSNPRRGQKISEKRDVAFFSIGKVKDRALLVYMKRKPNESVFHALEPITNAGRDTHDRNASGGTGGLLGRFGRDTKSSEWFRVYKTFFIPSEAYAMQFLRSKLCIICARGFEIIDLDSMMPGTIPDFSLSSREDARIYNLHRRVETSRALAIYKTREGDFLLCYDSFACFVDRRGNPIRLDHFIEWEGQPHSVAFREPFILAFDSRFIEVRDSNTGQLVQLLRTSDLRNVTISSSSVSDDNEAIFLVQRAPYTTPQNGTGRRTHDYQQVFEVVGTLTYVQLAAPLQGMSLAGLSGDTTPTSVMHGTPTSATSPTMLIRHGTTATTHTTASNGSSQNGNPRAGWI